VENEEQGENNIEIVVEQKNKMEENNEKEKEMRFF
jgi:hypothetical protein